MAKNIDETTDIIPVHQWTHDGKYVLIVKCLNRDGTTHNGFVWPESGPVKPEYWSRRADCESGGLFGWPWGMGIGYERKPDACAKWIVFRAKPENVIRIEPGLTVKAVPGDDGELPEVVFCGSQAAALAYTQKGRMAWIARNAIAVKSGKYSSAVTSCEFLSAVTSGEFSSSSTSGNYSSSSTSGDYSSASTIGESSSASTSGDYSSAITSGDYSSASTSGYSSAASTSGYSSAASTSGDYSSASTIGESSSASTSGVSSTASTSGYYSTASTSGESSSSSTSGYYSSASASGKYSSASASGKYSSASASGYYSSAKAEGKQSIAAACGDYATVEAGVNALAVATGRYVKWVVRKGAKLTVGWFDDDDVWQARMFDSADMDDVNDGDVLTIEKGEIVKE
jgi:hypothetical protein